jgi:glycosyltransferase involved in cell wall biosynthesis
MNILIINHYAGSPKYGMEYRPYYMAKEWQALGHEVRIIAGNQSHLRKVKPNSEREYIDGIEYCWVKTSKYKGNGIGRFINILSFVLYIYISFKKLLHGFKPEYVIASSTYPLDIFPAHRIARAYNAKLIYEVHDLWPLSPIELGGMSKFNPFIMLMQFGENYAYRKCNAVISMLPCAFEHMKKHGLTSNKFFYIPNGVKKEEWDKCFEPLSDSYQDSFLQIKKQFNFVIGYLGAHGIANSLHSLIDAADILRNYSIAFVLVGQGQEKIKLEKAVQEKKMLNVFFLPSVPKTNIGNILNFFDVAFIGLQNQSLFRFGISPNKLMDYMLAAKPIVCAINAGNDPVGDAKAGLTIEPENSIAIANAIKWMSLLSKEELFKMGENGHRYVLENHDYKVLAKDFINILQNQESLNEKNN